MQTLHCYNMRNLSMLIYIYIWFLETRFLYVALAVMEVFLPLPTSARIKCVHHHCLTDCMFVFYIEEVLAFWNQSPDIPKGNCSLWVCLCCYYKAPNSTFPLAFKGYKSEGDEKWAWTVVVCRQCGEKLQINTKRTECWVPESSTDFGIRC